MTTNILTMRRLPGLLQIPPFPMTAATIVILYIISFPLDLTKAGFGSIGMVDTLPLLITVLAGAAMMRIVHWRHDRVAEILVNEGNIILPQGRWAIPLNDLCRLSLSTVFGFEVFIIETERRLFSFLLPGPTEREAALHIISKIRDSMTVNPAGMENWKRLTRHCSTPSPTVPWVTLTLAILLALSFAIQSFLLPPQTQLSLGVIGGAVPGLLWSGDPTGLIMAGFVHNGPDHFWGNLLFLLVISPPLERRLGASVMASVLLIANVSGSLFATLLFRLQSGAVTVGASTMMFGLVGALLALRLQAPARSLPAERILPGPVWVVWAISAAISPLIDSTISWSGHIGGFIGGFCAVLMLARLPARVGHSLAGAVPLIFLAALLSDASALWREGEIGRRQTAMIATAGRMEAKNARADLWEFSSSPDLSIETARAALSLAERFVAEDEAAHGPGSTEVALTRLLAASYGVRLDDHQAEAQEAAEAVADSEQGSSLLPILVPLLDNLHQRRGTHAVPPGVSGPEVKLIIDQASSFAVPLDLTFEGLLPNEARALFLLRGPRGPLALLKITVPPGQAKSGVQRVIATTNSEMDMTGVEAVPLSYDSLPCRCSGIPPMIDARIWGITAYQL
jgi:membrane associated rhomboid family serine protease